MQNQEQITMKKAILLIVLTLITINSYGQSEMTDQQNEILQALSSKQQEKYFKSFIENKDSNQDTAYFNALRLIQDIDSSRIYYEGIGEIYAFISMYEGENLFKYRNAIKHGETAFKIYQNLQLKKEAARIQARIADYNFKVGDMHLSFNNILNAMKIANEIRDSISIRECALVMERIHYYYYKDVRIARAYNNFITTSAENVLEQEQRSRALNNLFYYPLKKTEVDSIINISEEIFQNYNIDKNLVSIYLNAVLKYIEYGEESLAEYYLKKSKERLSNIKDSGYYYSAAGYLELMRENYDSSIENINLAIHYLSKGDFNPQMLLRSYDILQWIYMTKSDYKKAYENLAAMTNIYVELVNEEKIIELSKSLNELKNERMREINKQYKSRIKFIIMALVIILLSSTLFFYIFIQRRKLLKRNLQLEEEKHKNELKAKDDMIKVKRLQQYQENIFIQHLINQLENISYNKETIPNQEIRNIIRQLESREDKSDWVEVEKSLEGNNTFMKNLVEAHPDLTINERRLCTFMQMNMSTKEIANITHQTINGINAARTRLRKKFGLTGDDKSLIAYLDKFNKS